MEKQNNDLKEVLKEDTPPEKEEIKIVKHKKPIQLRDIENRSSGRSSSKIETPENIKQLLNKEKVDIFKQPWNRLDTGMKLNRIRAFAEGEALKNDLSNEKQEGLRKLLVDACRNNKLSKNTDVEYSTEECIIISVKILNYNNNGMYNLNMNEIKKIKKPSKSKSNIDRFISKKN